MVQAERARQAAGRWRVAARWLRRYSLGFAVGWALVGGLALLVFLRGLA
jgi:hypothetical protein